MQNMQLWNSVCKTDPAHTKGFTKGGGFKGTAIKPYWLMRRATETFGVCGIGWGWAEIENKVVGGVWCSKVRLWYVVNNQRGEIEQWGQTVMEGTNKNGAFVDEEAPKKAVTDGVTKCLSYLGFAGDVHMGLFDDSKYVDERKQEFSGPKSIFETPELLAAYLTNCTDAIKRAESSQQLKDQKELNLARWTEMKAGGNTGDLAAYNVIVGAYNEAMTALKKQVAE